MDFNSLKFLPSLKSTNSSRPFEAGFFCSRWQPTLTTEAPAFTFRNMAERPEDRPENRPLCIGVHGIGDHARRTVLPAIDACTPLRLAGISTRNDTTRADTMAAWSCPGWNSLDAMLAEAELDAVFVCSPIGCHHDDGLKVLTRGFHLWSEKAFTADLAQAEALVGFAAERDLAVCVSLAPVHHNLFHAIRRLITTDAIGRPRDIIGHFGFPHVARERALYDPVLGGGALLDMGYYPLSMAAELLGETPEVAGAQLSRDDGYAVDTAGAALFAFASGAQATAQWGYGRDYINEMTIVGETGTILANPAFSKPAHLEVRLELRHQTAIDALAVEPCNQFQKMLDAFAAATRTPEGRRQYRAKALEHQRLLAQVAVAARTPPTT